MINLSLAVLEIYPDLIIVEDFTIQDDGEGQYIKSWSNDKKQPTTKEIKLAWEKYLKKREARKKIEEQVTRFRKVQEAYIENPDDIDQNERIQFLEYMGFAEKGIFYPLEEYPAIAKQIEEWVSVGKLDLST